jgi:hypothetical protein
VPRVQNHAKHKRVAWRDDESCLERRILPTLQNRHATTIITAHIEAIHSEVGRQYPCAANNLRKSALLIEATYSRASLVASSMWST